ncbi:MAG: argininosuccinate synthase [Fidelibacterota bacterium]|nr:MAG: argininosuccinate synthase [Candidatus Neomarinimicrobiota bacterium]
MTAPVRKVVLAYSGGLDTSIIIPWLKENYGCEIIAYVANVGQKDDFAAIKKKALKTGAVKVVVEDLRETFLTDFIFPTLRAGAVYERKYLLGTSMARPLIAQQQVKVAVENDAGAVSHGCTGKGNDQVRFELAYMALDPKLQVIAPWREWDLSSREDALEYARTHGVPVAASVENITSHDENIWHISHEGGPLEDPWNEMRDELLKWTTPIGLTPDQPEYVELEFEQGIPVSINGEAVDPVTLMEQLNESGSRHGIGVVDLVENRVVGMKSRGIYETPGGTILYTAHRELEALTLDKSSLHYKDVIAEKYATMVYNGEWFTPLRESLDAFVDSFQSCVTGTVRVKLFKGHCLIAGRKSPYSLYREDFATFGKDDVYDQSDAEGFINLVGLPLKVEALLAEFGVKKGKYRAPDYFRSFKRD